MSPSNSDILNHKAHPFKTRRIENDEAEINLSSLKRKPAKHKQIHDYSVNYQDEIWRVYITNGPCQPILSNCPIAYNEDVQQVVLSNAPKNAMYISSIMQRKILQIFRNLLRDDIRKEIDN